MIIRNEQTNDYEEILSLTYEAFQLLDYPGRRRVDEHYLIYLLCGSPYVISELGFVAEIDGEIVGHILYTHSYVINKHGTKIPTITFGPLSVLPKYHRKGIGRALVMHSMDKARDMGFGAVLIAGVPDYYPKLGFVRAREYGITLPDGSSEDFLMAYELVPGFLSGGGTLHFDANDIFEKAENDEEGFTDFNDDFLKTIR